MNFTAIITFMALFNDYQLKTYAVISHIILAIFNSVGIYRYNEYEKILKKVQRAINNGASDEEILELLKEESSDFQNGLIKDVNYFEEKKGIYR